MREDRRTQCRTRGILHGMHRAAVLVLVLGVVLVWGAPAAQAVHQRKVGLGVGFSRTSVTGDLDGQSGYVDPGTSTVVLNPKLESGGGLHFFAAITLTENFALEALIMATGHDASHAATTEPLTVAIATYMLGGRLMLPIGDSLEVFGRAGLGVAAVVAERNAAIGAEVVNSTYGGTSLGYGGGLSVYLDPVSLEVSVLQQNIKLSTLEVQGSSQTVSGEISSSIKSTSAMLTLIFHFGSR